MNRTGRCFGRRKVGLLCAALIAVCAGILVPWTQRDGVAADATEPVGAARNEDAGAAAGMRAASVADAAVSAAAGTAAVAAAAFVDTRPAVGAVRVRATRGGVGIIGLAATLKPESGLDPDAATRRGATDKAGEVLFDEVAVGAYAVGADFGASKPVVVKAGEETVVDIAFDAGFVADGIVVDGAGAPLAGAGVYVDATRRLSDVPTVRADAEGRFVIPGLPVGQVVLVAAVAGKADGTLEVVGGDRDRVEARIVCADPAGVVELRCADAAGAPLAGASVVVELLFDSDVYWPNHAVVTNAEGVLRVVGVPLGDVAVRGRTTDGRMAEAQLSVAEGAPVRSELSFGQVTNVSGKVLASDGTTVVAGAEVRVVISDSFCLSDLTRTTGPDGTFRMPPLMAKTGLSIWAKHPTFGSASERFEAEACGADIAATLTLSTTGTLRVTTVDRDGRPVPNVPLVASEDVDGGGDFDEVISDANGRAVFYDLPPLALRVSNRAFAAASGWVAESESIVAFAGGPDVVLRLPAATPTLGVLKGRIVDAARLPIGSLMVMFAHEGDPQGFAGVAVTDVDGRFERRGLAAGTVVPRVDDVRTGLALLGEWRLAPGDEKDVGEIRLNAPAELVFRRPLVGPCEPVCELLLDYGANGGGFEKLAFDETGTAARRVAAGTYAPRFAYGFASIGSHRVMGPCSAGAARGFPAVAALSEIHVAAGASQEVSVPRVPTFDAAVDVEQPPLTEDEREEGDEDVKVYLYVELFCDAGFLHAATSQVAATGDLRATFPLRLPAGRHRVRVATRGYAAEATVVVGADGAAAGARTKFDLR